MNLILLYIALTIWQADWTNYGIDELLIRAEKRTSIFLGTRPLGKRELKNFLAKISPESFRDADPSETWLKQRLTAIMETDGLEYNIGIIGDSLTRGFLLFGKQIRKGGMSLCIEPIVKVGESKEYPDVLWKDVIGCDYLKGYLRAGIFNFSFLFGRAPIKWGPSPGAGFIISGTSPPFDMLQACYLSKKYKFSSFVTQLDPYEDINRYVSGHRIEYAFNNSFYLGVSEIALFGGKSRFPELYYLNPLFIYYPYQWNRNSKVNILWGFDARLFFKKLGFYTELMIDDFPYEISEHGEHAKIGVNLGLQGVFSRNYWLFEYKGVTRWAYNHRTPWQRYVYLDYPIGHPNGPDFDELFFGIVHHLRRNIDLVLDAGLIRKGEGTMNEPYPSQFPDSYWLTGELKHTYNIEFGLKWYRFPGFIITCKSGCIIEEDKTFPAVSFFVSRPGGLIL